MSYEQEGDLIAMFDPELSRRATYKMADAGGDWLLERVIANTPVSYTGLALQFGGFTPARTPGTLKRSWKRGPVEPRVGGIDPGFEVKVDTHDPIAAYVEWDTRPHIIRPRTPGGRLRFRTWPTGELVYARVVHHPGTKGQHMMSFAAHAATLNFDHIVDEPLRHWAREQQAKVNA
jgi:hypothetical protein